MSKGSFLLDTVLMQVQQQVMSLKHRTQWMAMELEAVVALEDLVEVVVPVGLVVMVLLEVQLETAVPKRLVLAVLVETRTTVEALGLVLPPDAVQCFKDGYCLEFLSLPENYSERDLQTAVLNNHGRVITELGSDFCFVASEYKVQVGNRDFAIDLVFFHRGLQALVAFDLKVGQFELEYLGKLGFYVEALDRSVEKGTKDRRSVCCSARARTTRWWNPP